tara:strand:+ start:3054 stop:3680 length:627 start_codon:yes stop_codon:yes gene_type:complete
MGFDLTGLKPTQRTEEPDILSRCVTTLNGDEVNEYWNAYREHSDRNPGVYFRNNVWYWRPLWNYVCSVCHEVMTQKQMEHGCSNSGGKINMETSRKMYRILETLLDAGEVDKAEKEYNENLKNLPNEECTTCGGTGEKKNNSTGLHHITGDESDRLVDNTKEADEMVECWTCNGHGERENWQNNYPFDKDNVRDFCLFLRDCGGFQIF